MVATLTLFAWEIYVELFATRTGHFYITLYHLDKIAHLLGGALVIALLFSLTKMRTLAVVLATVILVSLVWELWEVLYDPKTIYLFSKSRLVWARDTSGDIIFGIVGALVYYFSTRDV